MKLRKSNEPLFLMLFFISATVVPTDELPEVNWWLALIVSKALMVWSGFELIKIFKDKDDEKEKTDF